MNHELAYFKVGVDNLIFSVDTQAKRLLVLLVKRQQEPFSDRWSLPGTLVRQGESFEKAAYRILAEKIEVDNLHLEQLYSSEGSNRDPKEAPESLGIGYISVSYFALVGFEQAKIIHHSESSFGWYLVQELPLLAFDHQEIIEYGLCHLRNKLEYSSIAFDVLPQVFTLNDVYQLYTTILGENFSDYSNFRTRLLKSKCLEYTGVKVSPGAGRPARLYRYSR